MQIERQKVVFEKVVCEKEDEDDDDEGRDEEKFTMKERIDLEEEMIGKSVKEVCTTTKVYKQEHNNKTVTP